MNEDDYVKLYSLSTGKPNKLFWAWFAGFLDGEGTIGFWKGSHHHKNKKYSRYQPVITISNTNREVLLFIKNMLGGSVRGAKPKGINYKIVYSYCLHAGKGKAVLERIYPYLLIKREQAIQIIKYQNLVRKKNKTSIRKANIKIWGKNRKEWNMLMPLSEKEKNERMNIVNVVKFLNRRGPDV